MSAAQFTQGLLTCTVIDYGLLLAYFFILRFPHQWLYRLSGKPLGVSEAQFDAANFSALVIFKVAWIFLNLVPYIALRLAGF